MLNSFQIIRTLKRVSDVDGYRVITSDDLLNMDLTGYQQLRRELTLRYMEHSPRYLCSECGHPVYAPRHKKSGPYWKHYAGAPNECPWWTGASSSTDEVSKRQFQGQQESPLHRNLKYLIAELLELDYKVSDVVVDEHLSGSNGRRRPDVRADYDGRAIALELQLSTTQLPIIIERELFYTQEGRHLIWLTWDFPSCSLAEVRQAFLDIRTAHNDNLFTIDAQTVAESRRQGTLVIRVLWWCDNQCFTKLVTLADLQWQVSGLPFAVAPLLHWHVDFKARWAAMPIESAAYDGLVRDLWIELVDCLGLVERTEFDDEAENLIALLNCLLSLEMKRPVGSRQSNIAEVANTFLYSKARHKFAKIFEHAARLSGSIDLLNRPSVVEKLRLAKTVPQHGKDSSAARMVRALFPDWVTTR